MPSNRKVNLNTLKLIWRLAFASGPDLDRLDQQQKCISEAVSRTGAEGRTVCTGRVGRVDGTGPGRTPAAAHGGAFGQVTTPTISTDYSQAVCLALRDGQVERKRHMGTRYRNRKDATVNKPLTPVCTDSSQPLYLIIPPLNKHLWSNLFYSREGARFWIRVDYPEPCLSTVLDTARCPDIFSRTEKWTPTTQLEPLKGSRRSDDTWFCNPCPHSQRAIRDFRISVRNLGRLILFRV
ncbi:hypothetical protein Bbelb_238470 [Branchiostoma belcheri]|nr:hypothetical protein Bbelb_238470 [Branchiostoma belcheri]